MRKLVSDTHPQWAEGQRAGFNGEPRTCISRAYRDGYRTGQVGRAIVASGALEKYAKNG